MNVTDHLPQSLRSDAEENRLRILQAAREVFAEEGLAVSMRDIARRAEVGPATLYRRFPTKQLLVAAAFDDELRACRAIVTDGCADTDAWRGLRAVITRIGELNARNQGFTDAFSSAFPDSVDFTAHRTGMLRDLAELCRRAKAAGKLRPDFVLDDLVLIILAGRGLSGGPVEARVAAARRFSALAIDALSGTTERSILPPPARVTATAVAS
jgi:AcrR family transcriptional regulator